MKNLMMLWGLLLMGSSVFGQGPNLDWVNTMGSTMTANEEARDILTDGSGNVFVVGYYSGTADFDPSSSVYNLTSNGGNDFFVQKLDSDGNLLWAKSIGGINNDISYSLTIDNVGSVYVTGYFNGTVDFDPGTGVYNLTSAGGADIFIVKLYSNGNFAWAKSMAGNLFAEGKSITMYKSDIIYLTGSFNGTVDFDPGAGVYNLTSLNDNDIFLVKLDANGNFIWAKSMMGNSYDYSEFVTIDATGSVYICGFYSGTVDFDPGAGVYNLTSNGSFDAFVQKLDRYGNMVWTKSFGAGSSDLASSLMINNQGEIYIIGEFSQTVDFDPGIGIVNKTANGAGDIFLVKLNASGNFVWVKTIGGSSGDYGNAIKNDVFGNLYITGSFYGTVDFDPGFGVSNLTSGANYSIFVEKLDASGNFIWAKSMGGSSGTLSSDYGGAIAIRGTVDIYIAGRFSGTEDFDPNSGVVNRTALGNLDAFVLKLNECIPMNYNPQFTYDVLCDGSANAMLTVTGSPQTFGNPYYVYYLIEYFPGTGNPDVLVETISWWQQGGSPYVYSPGPYTFSSSLQSGKHYYVKLGMWDDCTNWNETRIYDIEYEEAAPQPECHFSATPGGAPTTTFLTCDNIYLIETYEATHGMNYNGYNLALWSRPSCGTGTFSWETGNWVLNSTLPAALDLRAYFSGVSFQNGREYQLQVAMRNECDGWKAQIYTFCMNGVCRPAAPTSTDEISNDALATEFDIKIYPNPVQSVLNISADEVEIKSLRVMNALGQTLQFTKENNNQLDVSELPAGMYVLEFETNRGLLRKQFIKQ